MKANEVPKKIYMSPAGVFYKGDKQQESDIEYIRTDAFIEKAKSWFIQQHTGMWNEFKNYMKGE